MKKLLGRLSDLFAPPQKVAEPPAKAAEPHPPSRYVYVEDDGTARELEADEVEYLSTKFEGGDGNRPYIKSGYEQLTPDKRIRGYLLREKLPTSIRVKSLVEAIPVETAEEAIRIAKLALPISLCAKSGARLERVIDRRTGRFDFGLPGIEVSSAVFTATIASGVWRVVRTPDVSATSIEQACFADVSAASGRVIRYGRP